MSSNPSWDFANDLPPLEPTRFVRLWPEVDVYGRLTRLLAAQGNAAALERLDAAEESAA